MQLEPEEPSLRTFSASGHTFKGFVNLYSLVAADTKRSGICRRDFLAEEFALSVITRIFTASVPTKPLNDAQMRGAFLYIYIYS